jgi:hypothetical protein
MKQHNVGSTIESMFTNSICLAIQVPPEPPPGPTVEHHRPCQRAVTVSLLLARRRHG